MQLNHTNNTPGLLDAFSKTRVIVPTVDNAYGTWATQVVQCRHARRAEVLGSSLAERSVFSYRAFDSADYAQRTTVGDASEDSLPAGGPPIHVHEVTTISALIVALDAHPTTRPLARKLERIPKEAHAVSSLAGLMMEPAYGVGLYYSGFARAIDSCKAALLATRDAERIKICEQAGFRVLTNGEIVVNVFLNSASGTGSQAALLDVVVLLNEARRLGFRLRVRVFILLASPNDSSDPNRSLENSGACLTAVAIAQTSPELLRVTPIGGPVYTWSEPIFQEIFLLGCASATSAPSSRTAIAEMLGVQAVVESFTTLLPTAAGGFVDGIVKHAKSTYGASIAWSRGMGRLYHDRNTARAIGTAAAANFISTNL